MCLSIGTNDACTRCGIGPQMGRLNTFQEAVARRTIRQAERFWAGEAHSRNYLATWVFLLLNISNDSQKTAGRSTCWSLFHEQKPVPYLDCGDRALEHYASGIVQRSGGVNIHRDDIRRRDQGAGIEFKHLGLFAGAGLALYGETLW